MESAGVYHDRYTRVDGQWRFAQRRYDRLYATGPSDLSVYAFPTADDVELSLDAPAVDARVLATVAQALAPSLNETLSGDISARFGQDDRRGRRRSTI